MADEDDERYQPALAPAKCPQENPFCERSGNKARNDLMCVDMLRSIKAGRSPILLTERTSQVDEFASRLTGLVKHIVVLKGGMGAKQRRAIAEQLTAISPTERK